MDRVKHLKTSDDTRPSSEVNLSDHVLQHINQLEGSLINSRGRPSARGDANNLIRIVNENYTGRFSDKAVKTELLEQIDQRIAALGCEPRNELARKTKEAWEEVRPHVQDAVDATRNQGWS